MRVHWLQHVPFEGLGSIGPWLESRGARLTHTPFFEKGAKLPRLDDIDWLIVMGGPMSVNDEADLPWLAEEKRFIAGAIAQSKIVLGICLGAQLIANALGAAVRRNPEREIGWFPVEPAGAPGADALFDGPTDVFHWHGEIFDLPEGATLLARSMACGHQAFSIGRRVLGLQFHLEMTVEGARALVGNCAADLEPAQFVQSRAEILGDAERFRRLNRHMTAVLDRLAAA